MNLGIFSAPTPVNESIKTYLPGSNEKLNLKKELLLQKSANIETGPIINGKTIKTGNTVEIRAPHDHSLLLGKYHLAGDTEVLSAIESALNAKKAWAEMPMEERASVFLRAAELLAGPYRDKLNAATMLGQSKNVHQAEIDAACELIDFWRFNVKFMMDIYRQQPSVSPTGIWNRVAYRPLEGFIFAVSPFNFTAIGGNLTTAPVLMGNVCVWKPASSAVLSAHYVMEILKEAGLPNGVINLVPGKGRSVGDPVLSNQNLAGIHFTGSTGVFNGMWKTIGENLSNNVYKTYPRIVGETGGKDFVFVYKDANVDEVSTGLVRGAFEYQGQKCSAASRAYVPRSMWPGLSTELVRMVSDIKMGNIEDFRNFMGAVIDEKAYENAADYIEHAKNSMTAEILVGGGFDKSEGFFVQPTIITTTDPHYKSMEEEIFAPILTIFIYEDGSEDETLELLDATSPYALTGAIFAKDRAFIQKASDRLVNAAGNFYINDKPTGAVVGQQPFGGARASGTNDKAGSLLNLMRWVSARTMKETFQPAKDFKYPHMDEE
ncbi:MAG: L-glutamate gamma-semialdehyde dehydrogenase [Deltaproteobacteria bacterium]|jgi:1-pyrroline-5-carboxylate dehydrogenase|nr:L-glutamate gamma-semialdehyde dehydrogenase [Deltaproteobacteria bacterium]MBT4525073.1 L-glutamate gamma-semialdehyde dehydrogenase [Deltaproteobacteria bacterium]